METSTTLNGTVASSTDDPEANVASVDAIMKTVWFRTTFIFLYSIIFLLGLSGNSLVTFVVLRNKAMQTITNIFITNLAISDIMMCLLAVPFTPLSAFLENWIFGETLCHLLPMSLAVSVYVSTLTSTAIAVDRFMVIVHPFKPRMKMCVCLSVIVAIWLIAITISLPLGVYQTVDVEDGIASCHEQWPKETARQFFSVTSLVLQYIVPCGFITYCYVKVSIALHARTRARSRIGSKNRDRDEIEVRRKRRTNKMLIAMISIFMCCWLPLNVVLIVSEYYLPFPNWEYFYVLFFTAHVIAMSSTVYNPFLYAWMNDNFRKEFRAVVPFKLVPSTPSMSYAERGSMYTAMDTQQTGLAVTPPSRTPPAEKKETNNFHISSSASANSTQSVKEPLKEQE